MLGGQAFLLKEPSSALEYVAAGREGIRKAAVEHLSRQMSIPMKDMAELLSISYKTLSRKRSDDRLDPLTSSMSIEIAGAVARGLMVFEDIDRLRRWLHKENRALGGSRPLDLLSTPTGIRMVCRLLHRIQEGILT
jgi:putative toxin-antitoxin system antitoxin component (TIGR02293 family)